MTPNPQIPAGEDCMLVDTSQAPKQNDLCYSFNQEDYTLDCLGEVLQQLDDRGDLQEGVVFYEGEAVRHAPSYYFDVDDLLDGMRDRAYDDAGEWADTFPDLPKEKVAELKSLVSNWLDSNLTITFFTVRNERKVEVTAEMIASHKADPLTPGA